MAITTYAELQTAVQNWLDRTDIASYVPDYITLGEAWMQRNLRVREMVATDTLTTASGVDTLPTDFLQVISVRSNGSPVRMLEPLDDQEFNRLYGDLDAGTPKAYLISGSSIYIAPVDDTTTSTLQYYQKIPVLSGSNTTNWLLTAYPDLYLFAALAEAELMDKNPQAASIWVPRRDATLNEIQLSGQFRYRGPSPQIRMQGVTP